MAKADVEAVLGELERVFSGEILYDEACMNLQLHTAQVRKQWPNLFKSLVSVGNSGNSEISLFSNVHTERVVSPAVDIVDYSQWAVGDAHVSPERHVQHVRWDITEAPMPAFDSVITLRGPSHRTRFHVESIEGDVITFMTIAILPLSSS